MIDELLRTSAPAVLGALVRRHGHFDECEDAVQEALLAAAVQWPRDGVPDNPRGWLLATATHKFADHQRSEIARRRREQTAALDEIAPDPAADHDDTLTLLFLCCHPALTPPSQVALTLRAVGGLTTEQIAQAFLVPESTMGQRISRAKQAIAATGATFELPPPAERGPRLAVVRHALYLIFNEGYTATSGANLHRADLTAEAIRLTRALHALLPADGETAGLLALMLLTDARRPARTTPDGRLVPLGEQDRTRWNAAAIADGTKLLTHTLATAPIGPYQVQAAIAAVHDEAPTAEQTDWRQILGLYVLLERLAPGPMVTLNHAVALAMVRGPEAGLGMLARLDGDDRVAGHHRVDAVRAHLEELAGHPDRAREAYRSAARLTTSTPERRYLEERAARLGQPSQK